MQEIERSAGSVEEAVEAALAELGLSEQEAEIEIVQEPRAGFLGLNSSPAVVRVRPSSAQTGTTGGAESRSPEDEAIEEQAEVAAEFLEGLLDAIGVDADVEPVTMDGTTYVDLWGAEASEGMGLLIGRHGHTLDALQELVRTVVQRQTEERCQVMVDVEDYRKRRRSHIVRRAREAARRVRKTGRPEALDPMTAFERKIVHDTVADLGGLETASEGEDPNRRVVIRKRS
jgi:spoIIIJ-associated protein